MNHEELINLFVKDQVILTGNESSSRKQHINTTLNYLSKMNPNMDWTGMTNTDAKLLYGDFLTSDLEDTTKALRSRFILQFFKFLIEEKHNREMTLDGILKLKPHTKKPFVLDESQILTEKQVISLLNYKINNKPIPMSQKLIIAFTFGGGARIGEVLNIKFKDIKRGIYDGKSYYRVFINDTKTSKHRTTFITLPYFITLIDDYFKSVSPLPENYVINNSDIPMKYSNVRYWFDKLRKLTGITCLTSHKGRKFNISFRIAKGESISSVSMTSHGSPNSPALKHYLHLREDDILSNMLKTK